MRAPYFPVALGVVDEFLADLFVTHGKRLNFLAGGSNTSGKLLQPFHIARVTHIHGRCQCRNALPWPPVTVREIVGNDSVGIGGKNNFCNRQTHSPDPDTRQRITKVTGWNNERRRTRMPAPGAQTSCDVICHLRQQATDIDAVGGCQTVGRPQLTIRKGRFYKALTIVEISLNSNSLDVTAPASHQLALAISNAGLWIQDDNFEFWVRPECSRGSATSVTGSGHQYRKGTRTLPVNYRQASGQKTRAKILE